MENGISSMLSPLKIHRDSDSVLNGIITGSYFIFLVALPAYFSLPLEVLSLLST